MARRRHLAILHSGGLRSLTATALVLNQPEPVRVTLLHVHDGRPAAPHRLEHLRRQADHYTLTGLREIELPHLYRGPTHQHPDGRPTAPLATPQLLTTALAAAAQIKADELHWPVAVDGGLDATARIQEQQILLQQLADLESSPTPTPTPAPGSRSRSSSRSGSGVVWETPSGGGGGAYGVVEASGPKLVTPLLSYTDVQVVELGTGLGVPWELSWSCLLHQKDQCGGCPACRRRREAFRTAGVIDPVFAPAGVV